MRFESFWKTLFTVNSYQWLDQIIFKAIDINFTGDVRDNYSREVCAIVTSIKGAHLDLTMLSPKCPSLIMLVYSKGFDKFFLTRNA